MGADDLNKCRTPEGVYQRDDDGSSCFACANHTNIQRLFYLGTKLFELLNMQPERCAIHDTWMLLRLTGDSERRARAGHHQSLAGQVHGCIAFRRLACQLPVLLMGGRGDLRHLGHPQVEFHSFSHPLNILRPLPMCWTCSTAINPVGIAQLVDEIALPGEVYHLFGNGLTERFVSPTGREIRKTNILLWTCS